MNPQDTYTIEQFIQCGNNFNISYDKFSIVEQDENGNQLTTYNILTDYLKELDLISVTVELDTTSYARYCYRPTLLAYDAYGTTELYFVIMALNGISDVKEFNMRKFKAIKQNVLAEILTAIYSNEKKYLDKYKSKLT